MPSMTANFFRLPGEIRNAIYEELLAMPGYICLSFAPPAASRSRLTAHRENTYEPWPICLGILRLNKRVYCEAVRVLYSRNKFDLSSSEILKAFLRQIGPQCSGLLRQIRVPLPLGPRLDQGGGHIVRDGAVVLQDESIAILDVLQKQCPSLALVEAVAVYYVLWAFVTGLPLNLDKSAVAKIISSDERVSLGSWEARLHVTKLRNDMRRPPEDHPGLLIQMH